jgi:6-phosphogluconolactonase (cycloisomerase 2 family)
MIKLEELEGQDTDRKHASHAHQVYLHGNELLVPDLGSDTLFRFSKVDTTEVWTNVGHINYKVGSGPRHVSVHSELSIIFSGLSSPLYGLL